MIIFNVIITVITVITIIIIVKLLFTVSLKQV